MRSRIRIESLFLRRKEAPLFNVRRSNHESDLAVEMLRQHPALLGPLVTHQRPLEAIESAFSQLESCTDRVGKIVIDLANAH